MGGIATNIIGNIFQAEALKKQRKVQEQFEEVRQLDQIIGDQSGQYSPADKAAAAHDLTEIYKKSAGEDHPHRGVFGSLLHGLAMGGTGILEGLGGMPIGGRSRLPPIPVGVPPGSGQTTGINAQTQLPGLLSALAGQQAAGQPSQLPQIPTIGGGPGPSGAQSSQLPQIPTVGGGGALPSQLAAPDAAAAARALPLSTGGRANIRVMPATLAGTAPAQAGMQPISPEALGQARLAVLAAGPQGLKNFQQEQILNDALRRGRITPEQYTQGLQDIYTSGGLQGKLAEARAGLQMRQEFAQQEVEQQIAEIERNRPQLKAAGMTDEQINEMEMKIRYGAAAPSQRAGSATEQEREDALQAKADELGKPKDKLTAKEKIEAVQGLKRTVASAAEQSRQAALQAKAEKLGKRVEDLTGQEQVDAVREASTAGVSAEESQSEAEDIAAAIIRGEQDPNLTGLSRSGVAGRVRKILGEKGYNLLQAQNDVFAVRTWIRSMNSPQQLRLAQAVAFTSESLNLVDNPQDPGNDMIGRLAKVLPQTKGRFKILNRAFLEAAVNGAFGDEAASDAQNLLSQINDLQSELGTVYMGGNSPTDRGLALAQEQLKGEWSEKVLRSSVGLARTNLRLRLNSIKTSQPAGVSPQGQQLVPPASVTPPPPAAPPVVNPPAASTPPPGIPAGAQIQRSNAGRWAYSTDGGKTWTVVPTQPAR